MNTIPTNYIELNWLAKKTKQITMPLIIIDEFIDYSGCYYKPRKQEIYINDKFIPLDKGLIVISGNLPQDFVTNSIAHEWRHHMQTMNHCKVDVVEWNNNDDDIPYKDKIINYFKDSPSELDALFYSNKYAPSYDTMQ